MKRIATTARLFTTKKDAEAHKALYSAHDRLHLYVVEHTSRVAFMAKYAKGY
ncbi:MAG: hypothetical protein ACYST2_06770 [Planctomycetota bacterium]